MPKQSAGILLYRVSDGQLEVMLVHPGGPFWARRDDGAWSIPKGEYESGEDPLAAARRELREETGLAVDEDAIALDPVRQKGGKVVHAWAVQRDFDPSELCSNMFEIEWPHGSGTLRTFPEVDRAGWFTLARAAAKILPSQAGLLEQMQRLWDGGRLQAKRR